MFIKMWTFRIIVTVCVFYKADVSDALSAGYLVLGSITGGPPSTHIQAQPIETKAGNTFLDPARKRGITFKTYSKQPMSIDVDYARKQIYIYNRYTANLERLNFYPENGFQKDIAIDLHSGLSRSNLKIALDWISNNIYWTDPTFKWIALQSLRTNGTDGPYRILVYDNVEKPTGIAVDPIHKYLFWSDVGSLPKIERSSLSGTARITILYQGIAYPTALDVDIASSKLYWVDSIRDSVERSNLDGTGRSIVKRISHTSISDIQVFFDVVFATDFDPNLGGKVRLFNKDTGVDDKSWPLVRYNNSQITCVAFYAPKPTITDHCSNNPCESICVSETTGLVCLCREGFTLNADGRTCSETTGSLHRALVWATLTTICAADVRGIHDEVKYISKNKTCFPNVGTSINWLTVDSHDRVVIFADGSDIYKIKLGGVPTKQRITSATENVTGLAVDWGDKNLYYCQGQQSGTGEINIFSQTTTHTHTLISSGLNNPKALIILPLLSKMIWIDGRPGGYQIKRANFHGSDIQTVVSWMNLYEPRDLTVDATTKRLYFIDGNSLKSVQLDGTKLTEVGQIANSILPPLKLHLYKNQLLVADAGINLDILSLTDSGNTTYTVVPLVAVTDISVVDITEQPEEYGPCKAENGECEHICVPLGQSRICQCSFGFVLDNNMETCSSEPVTDNFMYLSDWTHGAYRAHPERLVLDYSTGNIYYTAVGSSLLPSGFTGIGVVSPNGIHRRLISEGVEPRAIAIDPVMGFLFWTDKGTKPAVLKRAHTDGTNIVTLYTAMVFPNGIAIDTSSSVLYVTDGNRDIIYRCGYEANTCVQYFSDIGAILMDIQLLGNYLYYTAWNKMYITKLHKTNTNDTVQFANNAKFGRLNSISLYSAALLPSNIQSRCTTNNGRGNCSTLCHPTPKGFSCGCPDGEQMLSDGKTCPSATPLDHKSNDEKTSSTQIVYIGTGVGGTITIVIIVVAIIFVYRKYGRKTKTVARHVHNLPSGQALYENAAVILQTKGDICKKPVAVAENPEGVARFHKNENKYNARRSENHIYDEIDD
ncbi:low-density lipoprotein receptor-related protein 4-like [Dreissena polymorpha]|uniref:low-density lipoprotein receptor-related protein 4-like n=1 Tax=Dreissena polymorpha TaxID=45954 RepID=UPI00226434F8|nr:low-density lipoprotein receptor-related protein 4-like [Dreissena polymorpha]